MSHKNIEVEFRAVIKEEKYNKLKSFLSKNAQDLGTDDKDVCFYIFPDKLLKVVNNISQNSAKIVLKLNKIGLGSAFEEIEIKIDDKDIEKANFLFDCLGYQEVINSFQKRQNFLYKGVEIALKYSDDWGYHLEMEILINDINDQEKAEKKIFKIADELGVHLLSDDELKKIVFIIEEKYRNNNKNK